jgi:hypothetical protein
MSKYNKIVAIYVDINQKMGTDNITLMTFFMIEKLEKLCIEKSIINSLKNKIHEKIIEYGKKTNDNIMIHKGELLIAKLNLNINDIKNKINQIEDLIENDMNLHDFDIFIEDFYKNDIEMTKDHEIEKYKKKYSSLPIQKKEKKELIYNNRLINSLLNNDIQLAIILQKRLIALSLSS